MPAEKDAMESETLVAVSSSSFGRGKIPSAVHHQSGLMSALLRQLLPEQWMGADCLQCRINCQMTIAPSPQDKQSQGSPARWPQATSCSFTFSSPSASMTCDAMGSGPSPVPAHMVSLCNGKWSITCSSPHGKSAQCFCTT